jgi:hypothetical protein
MSNEPQEWRSIIDVIVPHPSEASVLALASDGGLALPRVPIKRIWKTDLGQICVELKERLGVATAVLRTATYIEDETQHQAHITYMLENRSPGWQPPAGARWISRPELHELASPGQQAVIDSYFIEVAQGAVPEQRMPWWREGWLDQATGWIEAQLAALGMPLTGSVIQVQSGSISCILRTNTAGGAIYFKATANLPLFVNEPVMMAALAQRHPDLIPAPLCFDPVRRWMLLPDFGQPVRDSGTLAARQDMLRIFGGIQRESIAHVEELLALGCLDRRLQRLPEMAANLAGDTPLLIDLTEPEIAQFRAALPKLAAMCLALGACGVPETLVHGDLHLGNVALRDGKYIFFDWTDTCITHPFFDLLSIFDDEDRTAEAQLRDEYLRVWEGHTSRELLLEAWALAQPLSDLHQAISYQHILNGLEPLARGDFRSSLPFYIRKMLKAAELLNY